MTVIEYIEKIDEEDLEININSNEQLVETVVNPVFIISQNLSDSDLNYQLLILCRTLFKLGYHPFVYTENGGSLVMEVVKNNVVVINANGIARSAKWLDNISKLFNMVFANTLHVEPYVTYLAPKVARIYWWLHENADWFMEKVCINITDVPSLYILGAGSRTVNNINKYMKRTALQLNECASFDSKSEIPDIGEHSFRKKRFLWMGKLNNNTAVDIFLNAIITMPKEYMLGADYYILAPKDTNNEYLKLVESVSSKLFSIHYMETISNDELSFFMDSVDVVVNTSFDEVTGHNVLNGLMKGKVIICSDGCGITDILHDSEDSFIFHAGNYEVLREKMMFVIDHYEELGNLKIAGNTVCEKYYSFKTFEKNLNTILYNTSIINHNMNLCSGCGACMLSCPAQAITMKEKKGFLYPEIDFEKCIKCGKCRQVCPVDNRKSYGDTEIQNIKTYAFVFRDETKRMESQSGGAFTALAEKILSESGVVFGACLDNDNTVRYTMIEDVNELYRLKKSKYVQSLTDDIFEKVKKMLQQGRKVLFGGTSCHINGLINYIGENDSLYTCDLICHGVPSPLVFKKYIEYLEQGGKVSDFVFRDKPVCGWHSQLESWNIDGTDSKIISKFFADLFYSQLIYRECCYGCQYASFDKPADITIGDFWGIENALPDLDDNKGVSLVMGRSGKGKALIQSIEAKGLLQEVSKEKCIQPNLQAPSSRPYFTDLFWDAFYDYPFSGIYPGFVKGQYYNFNENVINIMNKDLAGVNEILSYAEKHNIKIDAVCGNWKITVSFINGLISMEKEVPKVIDVFDRKMYFRHFDTISLKDYVNNRSDDDGIIIVLEMDSFMAYLDTLASAGVDSKYLLPLSFIMDDEV